MPFTLPFSAPPDGVVFNLSGTSTLLTPIATNAKRVSVAWRGMLTNTIAPAVGDFPTFFLGDSGGLVTTPYSGAAAALTWEPSLGPVPSPGISGNLINANAGGGNSGPLNGTLTLIKTDISNHVYFGTLFFSAQGTINVVGVTAAFITLPDTLAQIAVTTANGIALFTAGQAVMIVEG